MVGISIRLTVGIPVVRYALCVGIVMVGNRYVCANGSVLIVARIWIVIGTLL